MKRLWFLMALVAAFALFGSEGGQYAPGKGWVSTGAIFSAPIIAGVVWVILALTDSRGDS